MCTGLSAVTSNIQQGNFIFDYQGKCRADVETEDISGHSSRLSTVLAHVWSVIYLSIFKVELAFHLAVSSNIRIAAYIHEN